MKPIAGAFVISLDFEIMWGVRDKPNVLQHYRDNLLGVRQVIPALLEIFTEYNIRGTFATVGMLFAAGKDELLRFKPDELPLYEHRELSPYQDNYFHTLGRNEAEDPLHYGAQLIDAIHKTPGQEIGSHTFCHYYCLEKGQTLQAFRADIKAAMAIAQARGIQLKSLVFPRNQFNSGYLQVLAENGFVCYRGNERSWLYKARNREEENPLRRLGRLADTYFNLSGNNIYSWREIRESGPLHNIPASRFLRPYHPRLRWLETVRLRRILSDMTAAARKGCVFHLWWHPHNFGTCLPHNLSMLHSILNHYKKLNLKYGFQSLTMTETAQKSRVVHDN